MHKFHLLLNSSAYNFSSNTTNELFFNPKWTLMPVVSLLIFIFSSIGNGLLLIVFIKERSLRTPFNIYVMNLLIANLVCLVFQFPMDIFSSLYSSWLLGERACTLYLYANFVLEANICNAHLLIAINRIWAVCNPLSYLTVHSVRTAVVLCIGVWVYVHVAVSPVVFVDALYYRLPLYMTGCLMNAPQQKIWCAMVQVIYWIPEIVMILTVPLMFLVKRAPTASQVAEQNNKIAPVRFFYDGPNAIPKISITNPSDAAHRSVNASVPALGGIQTPDTHLKSRKGKRDRTHGVLVLTLLTMSVAICWTPSNVYYTISLSQLIDNEVFYQLQTVLFIVQTVVDPVIFMLALANLRTAVFRLFRLSSWTLRLT
ncbi:hypothetical protein BV898_10029 [Hypsibius exemplaris]|uniref:G-protein coupled receptors family 1 profile domain-containing protein n=1 Tax=Hypsibius exemplaris TaxID=2072580 RepID=A0A1W0WKP4_HYPEX|nr:hypothetical protein BV898_10029 [Hypsibius exemplaris]